MNNHTWLSNQYEHKLEESIIPQSYLNLNRVFWPQGYFYFGEKKRIATVTDVKFITDDTLVIAHREAARLYLVKIFPGGYELIDCLILRVSLIKARFFHPDLIVLNGNRIYMTEYSNRCCVVDIVDNKLVLNRVFSHADVAFHGCFYDDDKLLVGTVSGLNIPTFDKSLGCVYNYKLDGDDVDKRIKTIYKDNQQFLLGLDKQFGSITDTSSGGDSWFNVYHAQDNKLTLLDSLYFPNTQIDGHAKYDKYHFVTMEDNTLGSGCIVIISLCNGKLKVIDKVPCASFPHGIDVRDNILVYTSYANSSFSVCEISLP